MALLPWLQACAGGAQSPLGDSFNPGDEGIVYSLAVQADGKILVGGAERICGYAHNLDRLNADGTLDGSFNPGANGDSNLHSFANVTSVALQADGKILVGAWFTALAGQSRPCIGRLRNTGPATQSLVCNGSSWFVDSARCPATSKSDETQAYEHKPDCAPSAKHGSANSPAHEGAWQA